MNWVMLVNGDRWLDVLSMGCLWILMNGRLVSTEQWCSGWSWVIIVSFFFYFLVFIQFSFAFFVIFTSRYSMVTEITPQLQCTVWQLGMSCLTDTNWTTGGRHRIDQTDVQVEASEGHGRRCRRQLSDQVNTEQRHHPDQQPGVGRYKPSSQPFWCCDTGDRLIVSGMRLLLSKNSCSRLCTTLSNDWERKDRFDTDL